MDTDNLVQQTFHCLFNWINLIAGLYLHIYRIHRNLNKISFFHIIFFHVYWPKELHSSQQITVRLLQECFNYYRHKLRSPKDPQIFLEPETRPWTGKCSRHHAAPQVWAL